VVSLQSRQRQDAIDALCEKEVLLREVHHRVKNNLQIVSSILSIQAGTIEDEAARLAFDECQNRIQAMSLVHEEVYRTGSFVELGMAGYLSQICETLRWGRSRGACEAAFHIDVDDSARLSLEKAIPCGLIVNELVADALGRASSGSGLGTVSISFRRSDADWRLLISDDGVGPEATAHPGAADIGKQLVEGLVAQLRGSIRYETPAAGGNAVSVIFPA